MRLLYFILLLVFVDVFSVQCVAQDDRKIIQFSGIVLEGDSLEAIPFTTIILKGTNRGTTCDYFGYYSIVVQENDTIRFSAVGYKTIDYVIPDSLEESRYSLIQILRNDTVELEATIIYPWPTKEQFKEAFLALELPDDDYERARKNLSPEKLAASEGNVAMTGELSYKRQMQNIQSQLYYAGQLPPLNIFNPLAWAQFVKAWRNGEFKRKKD